MKIKIKRPCVESCLHSICRHIPRCYSTLSMRDCTER